MQNILGTLEKRNVGTIDETTAKGLYHQLLYGTFEMSGDGNHPYFDDYAIFEAKDDNGEEKLYFNPVYSESIRAKASPVYREVLGARALRLSRFDGEISDSEWETYASHMTNSYGLDAAQRKELEEFVKKHGDRLIVKMYGKYWTCPKDSIDYVDMSLCAGTMIENPDSKDKRYQEYCEKNLMATNWRQTGLYIDDGEAPFVSVQVANMDDLRIIANGISPADYRIMLIAQKEAEKEKMLEEQAREQEYEDAEKRAGIVTRQRGYAKKQGKEI